MGYPDPDIIQTQSSKIRDQFAQDYVDIIRNPKLSDDEKTKARAEKVSGFHQDLLYLGIETELHPMWSDDVWDYTNIDNHFNVELERRPIM